MDAVSKVREALSAIYSPHTSAETKQEANVYLLAVQREAVAWDVIVALIAPTESADYQFMGFQMLYLKSKTEWLAHSPETRRHIIQLVKDTFFDFATMLYRPHIVITRLTITAAVVMILSLPQEWPLETLLQDLQALAERRELRPLLYKLLGNMAEEVTTMALPQTQINHTQDIMTTRLFPHVLSMAMDDLVAATMQPQESHPQDVHTHDVSIPCIAVTCLTLWIRSGVPAIDLLSPCPLLDHLVALSQRHPPMFAPAAELIAELSVHTIRTSQVEKIYYLIDHTLRMCELYPTSTGGDDEECSVGHRKALMVSSFVGNQYDFIVRNTESGPLSVHSLLQTLLNITRTGDHHAVAETLEAWYLLQDEAVLEGQAAHFRPLYLELMLVLIRNLRYPCDIDDDLDQDDLSFRRAVSDTLLGCFLLLGNRSLTCLLEYFQGIMWVWSKGTHGAQPAGNSSVTAYISQEMTLEDIEGAVEGAKALCEGLSELDGSGLMPAILNTLSQLSETHWRVGQRCLEFMAITAEWIGENADDVLDGVMQLILRNLNGRLCVDAIRSLHVLVAHRASVFVPVWANIAQPLLAIFNSTQTADATRLVLAETVARVASYAVEQPNDVSARTFLLSTLNQWLLPVANQFVVAVDANDERDTLRQLKLFVTWCRFLESEVSIQDHPLLKLLEIVWPSIEKVTGRLSPHNKVHDEIATTLAHMLRHSCLSVGDGIFPYLDTITGMLTAMYTHAQSASILEAICVFVGKCSGAVVTNTWTTLPGLLRHVVSVTVLSGNPVDKPDLIKWFLLLLVEVVENESSLFFSEDVCMPGISIAISSLGVLHQDPPKAAVKLFSQLCNVAADSSLSTQSQAIQVIQQCTAPVMLQYAVALTNAASRPTLPLVCDAVFEFSVLNPMQTKTAVQHELERFSGLAVKPTHQQVDQFLRSLPMCRNRRKLRDASNHFAQLWG
eukprot:GFYU01011567.1.p1 GENE.GFYU01011567.1~~GFYU01011567.1.p1  ORF type:complete len:994 (-),score=222.80 GFYU01011567.1:94-2955(-)